MDTTMEILMHNFLSALYEIVFSFSWEFQNTLSYVCKILLMTLEIEPRSFHMLSKWSAMCSVFKKYHLTFIIYYLISLNDFFCLRECVMCMCIWGPTEVRRGVRPSSTVDAAPNSCEPPNRVLGMEFRSSGRASNALMFEPLLQPSLLYIFNIYN